MKKLLGTLSPVYGMATGEGLFGEAVGALPAIAKKIRERRDEDGSEVMQNPRNVPVDMGRMAQPAGMAQAPKMMKKGGMVSKGIDGCATKGKTRANRSK